MRFFQKNKKIFEYVIFSATIITFLVATVVYLVQIKDVIDLGTTIDSLRTSQTETEIATLEVLEYSYTSMMMQIISETILSLFGLGLGFTALYQIYKDDDTEKASTYFSISMGILLISCLISAAFGCSNAHKYRFEVSGAIIAQIVIAVVGILLAIAALILVHNDLEMPTQIINVLSSICFFVIVCISLDSLRTMNEAYTAAG